VALASTLINILAGDVVANALVARKTIAGVASDCVGARGALDIAAMRSRRALIDVSAIHTVAHVATPAGACKRACSISAACIGAAGIRLLGALVDVITRRARASVSNVAPAAKRANSVGTNSVIIAAVDSILALVHISARKASARVSSEALARVSSRRVGAHGMIVTHVCTKRTLVKVCTHNPSPGKSTVARTLKRAHCVGALAVEKMAVIGVVSTLVDVNAGNTVSTVASVAEAGV